LAPLVILRGVEAFSAFSKPELDALAFVSLRTGNQLGQLLGSLWGLWLLPFGLLTLRSG
jgi:hypothetical protein